MPRDEQDSALDVVSEITELIASVYGAVLSLRAWDVVAFGLGRLVAARLCYWVATVKYAGGKVSLSWLCVTTEESKQMDGHVCVFLFVECGNAVVAVCSGM